MTKSRFPRASARRLPLLTLATLLSIPPAVAQDSAPMPFEVPTSAKELGHSQPVISPSGKWIGYVVHRKPAVSGEADRFLPNGVPGSVAKSVLTLTEIATGRTREIGQSGGNCWRPVFSPDERLLASYCDGGNAPQLWIHDLAAGTSRKVSDARIKASLWSGDEPMWSPDGRELLVPLAPETVSEADRLPVEPPKTDGSVPAVIFQTNDKPAGGGKGAEAAVAEGQARYLRRLYGASMAAIDVETGKVRMLVAHDATPAPNAMLLSPSGKWVSYTSMLGDEVRGEGKRPTLRLVLVPRAGGAPRVIEDRIIRLEKNYLRGSYSWHPSRDQLFWVRDAQLWTASAEDGFVPRQLGATVTSAVPSAFGVTADGKAAVVAIDPRDDPAYSDPHPAGFALVPLDGGPVVRLTVPARYEADTLVKDAQGRLWQPDGHSVAVRAREDASGMVAILRLDFRTQRAAPMWKGHASIDAIGTSGKDASLFAIYEDYTTPEDIYRFAPDLSRKQRVSHVEPRLDGYRFQPPVVFNTAVKRLDGAGENVRSVLYLPPGTRPGAKLPTLVTVYPRSSPGTGRFAGGFPQTQPASVFTTRGYAVLATEMPVRPMGTVSPSLVDDILAMLKPQIDHAVALGYVDRKRMAVSGQSFGGYSTASLLAGSDLFRGGIALAGVYDITYLATFMGKNRDYGYMPGSIPQYWNFAGDPWADKARWIDASPFFQAEKIKAPLFIGFGSNDIAPEDSRRLFNALRQMGKTVELAEYQGEGHVPSNWAPVNAADLAKRAVEFLDRYVKPVE